MDIIVSRTHPKDSKRLTQTHKFWIIHSPLRCNLENNYYLCFVQSLLKLPSSLQMPLTISFRFSRCLVSTYHRFNPFSGPSDFFSVSSDMHQTTVVYGKLYTSRCIKVLHAWAGEVPRNSNYTRTYAFSSSIDRFLPNLIDG